MLRKKYRREKDIFSNNTPPGGKIATIQSLFYEKG
jgi:hypothetical protein